MRTRTLATLALVALVLLVGCPPPDVVVPPPIPPPDTDWCGTMCEHLQKLGCEEGEPVYNSDRPGPPDVPNQTCKEWCEELQDPDHSFFINPRCVSEVASCDQIEGHRKRDPESCTTATK